MTCRPGGGASPPDWEARCRGSCDPRSSRKATTEPQRQLALLPLSGHAILNRPGGRPPGAGAVADAQDPAVVIPRSPRRTTARRRPNLLASGGWRCRDPQVVPGGGPLRNRVDGAVDQGHSSALRLSVARRGRLLPLPRSTRRRAHDSRPLSPRPVPVSPRRPRSARRAAGAHTGPAPSTTCGRMGETAVDIQYHPEATASDTSSCYFHLHKLPSDDFH